MKLTLFVRSCFVNFDIFTWPVCDCEEASLVDECVTPIRREKKGWVLEQREGGGKGQEWYRPILGVDADGPQALQNAHPRAHATEYRVLVVQERRRCQRQKEL